MSQAFDSKSQPVVASPTTNTEPDLSLASLQSAPGNWREKSEPERNQDTVSNSGRERLKRDLEILKTEMTLDRELREQNFYGEILPETGILEVSNLPAPDYSQSPSNAFLGEIEREQENNKNKSYSVTGIAEMAARAVVGNPPPKDSEQKESRFRTAARELLNKIPRSISGNVDTDGVVSVSYKKDW
jgi:hypothetical protein